MITIKYIAKLANVSEGTVDRVLHQRGGVSKKTEERVKALLLENNFKVNPIARALAMKKKYNLSVLIPEYDTNNLFWKMPYLGIKKAREEVNKFGVQVNTFSFNQSDSASYINHFQNLLNSNPDAVIITPTLTKETKTITDQLEEKNIPYMFLNIDLEGFKNISFIGQDAYTGGLLAAKLMHLSLGNTCDFLTIETMSANNHTINKRIEGYHDYFLKNKTEAKRLRLKLPIDLKNLKDVKQSINTFLKENSTIKGIFVPSSRISIIANCIENISAYTLIGFDNTEQNIKCLEADKVSFLISQQPFRQGYESVHLMSNYLFQKQKPLPKIYSPIDILTKENVKYSEGN